MADLHLRSYTDKESDELRLGSADDRPWNESAPSIVGYKEDGEFTFKSTLVKVGGEFIEAILNKV